MNYYDGKDDTEIEISVPIHFDNLNSYEIFALSDIWDFIDAKSNQKNVCQECKVIEGEMHDPKCKHYSQMPFIAYPSRVCKRCGKIDYSKFRVSDEIWKKYIPYNQDEFTLCINCFDHIREIIEKKTYNKADECWFCGSKNIICDPKREKHKYYYNCNDCGSGWY